MTVQYWTQVPSDFTGTVIRDNPNNYSSHRYGIATFKHGYFHCEDGPAVVYNNGDMIWSLNGKQMNFEDFFDHQKDKITEEQLNHILFNLDLFARKHKDLSKEQLECLLR